MVLRSEAGRLGRWAVVTRGMRRIGTLPALLDDATLCRTAAPRRGDCDGVLAWGRKPSARAAQAAARRAGLPVVRLEDGFLRSVGLGNAEPPLSVVLDDLGIYYDASAPSRLETLIATPLDAAQAGRAAALQALWCGQQVSKYNHAPDFHGPLPEDFVLVVDQTFGDLSIRCGQASAASFREMLDAALREHPGRQVVLKTHPDVLDGRKRGHFDLRALGAEPRVTVLAADVHPAGLLRRAAAVYTVTSQLGFEALLWGVPVRTFGMPFYAGWGLTRDALPAPARRGGATLAQLVHAALVAYPRYLDPESGRRCEPETLIAWMGMQRRMRARLPAALDAYGFSRWKRPLVRRFLDGPRIRFLRAMRRAGGRPLVLWGRRHDARLARRAGVQPPSVLRLEDGFLRSVGLGAMRVQPLSWVVDDLGIYYDAARPSRLESLLREAEFDAALLARAAALRERICAAGATKYNLEGRAWARPAGGRPVVLVPGQVEGDASIRHGAARLRRNIELLAAVRQARPDAYLLYKPHPDVVARMRRAGKGEADAVRYCDEVVSGVAFERLLEQVDEVHVLTSLAGFEALLRGKSVVTYGQPFYAGWGLTEDRDLAEAVRARRDRRLSLDMLVAGALILYPTYVHPRSQRYTTPEAALDALLAERGRPGRRPARVPAWQAFLNRWFWFL